MHKPLSIIFAAFALLFTAISSSYAFSYNVIQLTNNTTPDSAARINANGEVVWMGSPVNQLQIYHYDGAQVTRLTQDDSTWNSQVCISQNGQVAWAYEAPPTPGRKIYHYNGTTSSVISDTGFLVSNPAINNNSVIWSGRTASTGGNSTAEIWLYNGSSTARLTNNTYGDNYAQINQNGQAVWTGSVPFASTEIFYYNGSSVIRLTNNQLDDSSAQINDDGYVVWQRQNIINSQSDYNIYLYDGTITKKISTLTDDDKFPQINSAGHVVWHGFDGSDYEIFLYDGSTTVQVTNNLVDDLYPDINDRGYIAWKGHDGNDYEIFFTDGSTIIQLTDNAYDDGYDTYDIAVEVNANGDVVWSGSDGTDTEIFMATSPPSIISTSPADNDTGVAVDSVIDVEFSEGMDSSTIDTNTFSLDNGVTGSVSYNASGTSATFTPSADLDYSTTYTVTVTTGVEDQSLNPLQADYSFSFTTDASPDITPPDINSTTPADNESAVAINTAITATFSEALNAATVTSATFSVNDGVSDISGSVNYTGTTASFIPSANLDYGIAYTVTITTGVQDVAGNALPADYTWSFTSATAPDTTSPSVTSTSPLDNATGVSCNAPVEVTFSEPMNVTSIDNTTFTLNNGVTGTVSCDINATTATFTPSVALDFETAYTATISTSVEDQASNQLQTEYSWTFTTESSVTTSDDFLVNGKFGGDGYGCVISSTAIDYQVPAPVAISAVLMCFFLSVLVIFIKWCNRQHIR